MKKFKILSHTADLKIRVFGKDKKEVFKNALIGMFKGARYERESKSQESEVKVEIKSQDLASLLVDFLSEVLYLSEVKHEVYYDIRFKKFFNKGLEGILLGKKLKRIGTQVKGVTYHDLDIHQREDGTWQATILFDV